MGCRWQILLTLALMSLSFVASKPTTQDTLVVSRSEDEVTTSIPSSDVTTEEPNPPIKLTEMDVQSKISLRYAFTAVVTRVRNPARRAQETTFRMLLPDTAFISGFTMTIDGKAYKAYVKEKEEAKQIYSDAVSHGFGAAHIAAKARDSNHFTVTVNVEPNSTVMFNLTYEELLVRRNGVYNHAINMHPGNLVPKMKVTVHIKEAEKISALRVPEVRTGNEIDAVEDDPQNAIAVIQRTHDDREAIITFSPDINEQRRLMEVYAQKSKESLGNNNHYYKEDDQEKNDKEGLLGQFVVQYDVDRSKVGEILVNDGYFVHFFAPTSLPPLPKHVVFVLDTSGSMMGRKVVQLREAMQTILSKLNKNDYFSIVEFNSYVQVLDLKKADEPDTSNKRYYYFDGPSEPTTLIPPSEASSENIAKAKIIVSRLEASGGTNIASALDVAVDLIHRGMPWGSDKPHAEKRTDSDANDASQNNTTKSADDKAKNKLEPIIIFLTDGDPTVGDTNPTRIIARLSEKNYGEQKASIYSLAFGEDADRKFLRQLSLRNEGFMRHIYEAADAALQLQDFYRSVSSPLLADVKFLYPKAQIKEGSLTKHHFRTYYAGSETVVAGRIEDQVTELEPQVLAFCGVQDSNSRTRYEISPKVPVLHDSNSYYPLERVWAYLTIKQLLDQKDAFLESKDNSDKEKKKELERKALDIALKYEMVTPLTSLVVVKPNDTKKAVDAESVDDYDENLDLAPSRLVGGYSPGRPLYAMPVSFNMPQPIFPRSGVTRYAALHSPAHFMPAAVYSNGYAHRISGVSRPSMGIATALHSYAPAHGSLADAYEYASEDEDDTIADRIVSGPNPTTPADIRFMMEVEEPTTTSDPLEPYSLKEFPWAMPLLDAASDSLRLNVNGTQVDLKLVKDNALSTSPGTACTNAPGGVAGNCVYLTRCAAARTLSTAIYETAYCIYDNGYAGVCCPEHKEDTQSP